MAVIKDIDITNYETKTEEVEITDPTGSYSLGSIISGVKQRDVFLGTGFSIVKGATVYVEGRDFSLSQTNEDSELTERYGVALYSAFKSYKLSGTVTVTYRQVATYVVSALPIALEERMSVAEGDIDTLTSDIAAHENNTEIHVTLAWKLAMEAKSAVYSTADITARDALTGVNNGDICRVADAGDGKFASYLRVDGAWTVLSDADWENLSVAWSALTNVPANISALASAPNISTASVGQVPAKSASGGMEWITAGGTSGLGDMISDESSTIAGNIFMAAGTSGKHFEDSGINAPAASLRVYSSPKIEGLIISNNLADVTNDLDISPGFCADSTRSAIIRLSSALTKRLDATWSAGNNAGLLQAGQTKGTNESYRIYLIASASGNLVDVIATKYNIALSLPSGYTWYRYLLTVMIDSSGALTRFDHLGNEVLLYNQPPYIVNGSLSAGNIDQTVSAIPLGMTCPVLKFEAAHASTGVATTYINRILPDGTIGGSLRVSSGASGDNQITGEVVLNAAYQFRITVITTGTRVIWATGYIDRDREAY